MDLFRNTQRQVRFALAAAVVIVIIGVSGYMLIENMSFMDALWMTVETLTTIGYGDVVPRSTLGRVFTVIFILIGLSVFAFGLQAAASFIINPRLREARLRRRIQSRVDRLHQHYILCGAGELVDRTVANLMDSARQRQQVQMAWLYQPVDRILDRLLGDASTPQRLLRLRQALRILFHWGVRLVYRAETLLDVIVLVTPDRRLAENLREAGLLVIEGEPTQDRTLTSAGIERAQGIIIMLNDDTETLLTTLTARALNPHLNITAAALEEDLAQQMIRAGANSVIAPYDVAGQFLNSATLRPAVNEFFMTVLDGAHTGIQTTTLYLDESSPWVGQTLEQLDLRRRFQAGVLAIQMQSGEYRCAPPESHRLNQTETVIVVAPANNIPSLLGAYYGTLKPPQRAITWQRLTLPVAPPARSIPASIEQGEQAIGAMNQHFIICGSGRIARNAINKLDPARPFVILTDQEAHFQELRARGFHVILGSLTQEFVLKRAGASRAQAIMIALEDPAATVLAVLNCRRLSKRLFIAASAQTNELIPKLRRAGADRVIAPFQVAAQIVLLTALRPVVSDFFQCIIYNYQTGLETTELYMEHDSPWIGQRIGALGIEERFQAGVIGVRQSNGAYVYAPPKDYQIGAEEVLIIVTPMPHADALRAAAHGSLTKRPYSLRRDAALPRR